MHPAGCQCEGCAFEARLVVALVLLVLAAFGAFWLLVPA
jgi:hypothetical protein